VAQQALPPGAVRRRVAFGLLDADGWTWAGLKATWWFLFIIFMLGYVPNVAYFITVSNTVEVGYNFASIVNWCPEENEDLPCPTPTGALLPWQTSPSELALPEARQGASVFQSGALIYLIGGETANGAVADVLVTTSTETGNLAEWVEAPSLPEARTDAALGVYVGVPYVVGGLDADGQPTDTVYKGIVDQGALTGWELANGENGTDPLTLPQPLSNAGIIPGTSGFVIVGGRDAAGEPVADVHTAWVELDSSSGRLLAWQPLVGLPLPEPRANPVTAHIGDFLYVVGGEGPDGATDSVYRLGLADQDPATDETGQTLGWATAPEEQALPGARTRAASFGSSTAIYVIGGVDATGSAQTSNLWAVPDAQTGEFNDGWQSMEQTDLPMTIANAPAAGVGTTALIFGGATGEAANELSDATMRAGLSPRAPFFQLGIAGATIPGLSIKGEVGQQLGYINAMTVGMINFVILILIGIAYSHQAATKRVFVWLSRGRLKMPPDEEYRSTS
jgi:hypothetical protein